VPSLIEQVETRVRQTTHDRIRDLIVREECGRILVQGQAPTQYAKQLALVGALELLSCDRLRTEITVESGELMSRQAHSAARRG